MSQDHGDIYQSIVDAVHRTTRMPVSLWALDGSGRCLVIKAAVGLPASYVREAILALDEPSLTGEAFLEGKVMSARDVSTDPRWKYRNQAVEMGWKSVLCAPVRVHNTVVAVLSVYAYHDQAFSELEEHLLSDYAGQIGLALEAERRRKTMQGLLDLGQTFAGLIAAEPKAMLQVIVQAAAEVTGADCAVIYPYDAVRQEFYDISSVVGYGLEQPLALKDHPRKEGLGAYLVSQKELVRNDIEREQPDMLKSPFITREGIKAFMGIALELASRVLGILYVDFRAPHLFTDEEKDTIRLFAHQAALAIDNSRLFQQAASRADALKKLHEVGPALVSIAGAPQGLAGTLTRIAQNAQSVLGADIVDLYQYVQSRDEYVLPPVQIGERRDPSVPKDKVHEDDVVCTIVRDRQPLFVADAQQEDALLQPFTVKRPDAPAARFVVREGIRSMAAIPLLVDAEIVGVLFANYRTPQTFPQAQRELVELFASQAAIAIRNARLFDQTQQQVTYLATLFHASDAIGRVLDLERVLDLILDRAFALVGRDVGYLMLIERHTNTLKIVASRGVNRARIDAFHKRPTYADEGTFGLALRKGKVLEIPGARHDPRVVDVGLDVPETLVNVPLQLGDHNLGLLILDTALPEESSRQLLLALADMAAVAIERARLFRQGQKLRELSRVVTSEVDLPHMLQTILDGALELVECATGSIGLLNKKTGALEFEQTRGQQKYTVPVGEGFTGLAFERRRPQHCGDVTQAERYYKHVENTRSELAVPLLIGDEALGVFNVESPALNAFTDEDEQILVALASQAAIAIKTARKVKTLRVLDEVGQALSAELRLDEPEILELIHTQAGKLMDADNMYIALYDEVSQVVRFGLAFVGGERVDTATDTRWQPRQYGRGRTEWIILNREPILITTEAESDAWYAQPGRKEYLQESVLTYWASWMGVPLTVGDRVIGVIAAYHKTQPKVYDKEDLQNLASMASQAAIALDNTRLYYNLDRQRTALIDIGEALTSRLGLTQAQICDLIHEQAAKLMGAENMYIALYDQARDEVSFGLAIVDGQRVDTAITEGWQPRQAGKGRTEWIIHNRQSILNSTVAEAEAWYAQPGREEYIGEPMASWMGVPLTVGDQVLGVIAAYHRTQEYVYDGEDLKILEAMAKPAAVALENARLYKETVRLHDEIVASRQLTALGTAMAALQHRINNTLSIIIPNLSRLRKRIDVTDPTIAEILDIIERNTRYTAQLVTRIQNILREIEPQDVDVNGVLNEVVANAQIEWAADPAHPPVTVTLDTDQPIPLIWAPIGQLTEVFANLVGNAFRAMKTGGQLHVSCHPADAVIVVTVQDNGPGIPASIQDYIFVRPVPALEPGEGAGLGLWLSRLILQSLGGDVIIAETGPTGTTMQVRIPTGERGLPA